MITIDSQDPEPLAEFWAAATGYDILDTNDGWFFILTAEGAPVTLAIQKVDDPVTPGKNRIHFDNTVTDMDAEAERLVALGASIVERRGDENFAWITLADPQGNEFCIAAE